MVIDFTNKRFIIAGGGTGGHLFPALAIGDRLQSFGAKIHYVGSMYGIESQILPKKKLDHTLFNIRGFSRHISIQSVLRNILFPFRFLISFLKSFLLILNFKPDAVIGTGGYSSGLPLLSAVLLSIPTLIHEQNSFPGITTRKLASRVNAVCIATPDSAKYLGNTEFYIVGNPVRNSIKQVPKSDGCEFFNFNPERPTLLVLGGCQGSKPINEHLLTHYSHFTNAGIQMVWQCGKSGTESLQSVHSEGLIITPFIDKIEMGMGMADVVISRAGAITLSELAVCGKPMVLIPYPQAAGNHQFHNAEYYASHGASITVLQHQLELGELEETILQLFNYPEKLQKMSINATSLAVTDAVEKLTKKIESIVV